MLVETLLPLGKVDPGLREPGTALDIRRVFAAGGISWLRRAHG